MDGMAERQPLLHKSSITGVNHSSEIIVDFDPNGDADNPMEWPDTYKWFIVALLAFMAFTVTFTCISVVPVANQIIADLSGTGRADKSASVLLVTIWELGEAAGPLLIAPLSEVFGRWPVVQGANLLFVVATVAAALAPAAGPLIAARFLTGLAVAANVLNPAIVGDLFASERRGTAMSFVMLTPLIGGALGPAASGAIAERWGWRAILWSSAVLAGACALAFLLSFRETYKMAILSRRARKLRRETGSAVAVRTVFEVDGASGNGGVWESIMRPAVVMWSSSVLQVVSLIGGVVYAYFYIMSTSLPDILEEIYGLNATVRGFAFISFSIGSLFGVGICNVFLDWLYVRLRDRNKGIGLPEYRLPFTIVGAFILPIVVALYGWVPQNRLPLSAELTTTGLWGFCLILAELPLVAYVVDAFGLYSASAMTAMIVMRCLMGTFLPMATDPLVKRFGYGWGFSFFALISLILAPVTILVMRYGTRWRQRSQYSRDTL